MRNRHPLSWRRRAVWAALPLLAGCGSSTTLYSNPPGAAVYIDGELVGRTPYRHSDLKFAGSETRVRLVLDGYATFEDVLVRNERVETGPLIGGFLFFFYPWMWVKGYHPEREYKLTPL